LSGVDQKIIKILFLKEFYFLYGTGSFRLFWAIPEAMVLGLLIYISSRCFTHEEKNHGKAAYVPQIRRTLLGDNERTQKARATSDPAAPKPKTGFIC
jgi:hypothetical protein